MSMASVAARSMTRSRLPGKWWHLAVTIGALPAAGMYADAIQTVPTGLSGVPPSGPAMPDVAIAADVPQAERAPTAICRTTFSLTAPHVSMSAGLMPRMFSLTSLA